MSVETQLHMLRCMDIENKKHNNNSKRAKRLDDLKKGNDLG